LQRSLQEHGEVQLSALGVAISSLVTVAEILKSRGLAVEKKIATMLESTTNSEDGRSRLKPKMEVTLVKSPNFAEALEADDREDAARKEAAAAKAAENGPETAEKAA
jgi:DNA-binding protein